MRYLKVTDEEVKKAAADKNIYIAEVHLEEVEVKKGRTKKVKEEKVEEDKKRGRPKKEEKKVEVSATEDLFATLVKEAEEAKKEEEEDEITVKKFEHKGVTYLRSSDNVIYDMNTEDAIGKWNEVSKCIDAYELEPEEEEEE